MCDLSKNRLSKVLQNFLSIFEMSQVLVKFLRNLIQISVKFWEKRNFFIIFVNYKEILMKILIGFWKYFAISKRFWVNCKEFPENYSGNIKLTLGKFQRIKKVNETSAKFYEKLDIFKTFNNMEEFWKNYKIFRKLQIILKRYKNFWENFMLLLGENLELSFGVIRNFWKNLKLINNEMCRRISVKYWENFQSIFKILKFLQKF